MTINWAGMAAAVQGAQAEQRRIADDERRARAAAREEQDAAFREEARDRQRSEWAEADRIKAEDKADREAVDKEFAAAFNADSSAGDLAAAQEAVAADQMQAAIDTAQAAPADLLPGALPGSGSMVKDPNAPIPLKAPVATAPATSPKLDPAVSTKLAAIAPAAGVPKPANFNDSLDRQLAILRRKMDRGTLSADEYASRTSALNRMKNEGVQDALGLMAQGRYDEAMSRYNSVGTMRGATIVKAEEGTTKLNGEDVPTHYVTVRNADGTRSTLDVTRAQYQMLDMEKQLAHADRARNSQEQREHRKFEREMAGKEFDARRKHEDESRRLQWAQFRQSRENTPAGKLASIEKALGRTLSPEERAQHLGFDTLPQATRAQLNSYLKQQDQISAAMNKAQAEGMWDPNSPGAKDMIARDAVLSQQVADLLGKSAGGAGADPLGLKGANGGGTPNPVAAPAGPAQQAPARRPTIAPAGGIRAPAAAPAPQDKVAQALGLSGDKAMNSIVMDLATEITDRANAMKSARDVYIATAKSGDVKATQAALDNFNTAREALNVTADRAGNRRDVALAVLGL